MTPNELRIGNFVKLRDSGEIVRVCRVSDVRIGYRPTNGELRPRFIYKWITEIEPVLIYDHWREIDCLNILWCDGYDDDKWYSYNINEWKYQGFKWLRYLHELQNLHFALTGEELKIEL